MGEFTPQQVAERLGPLLALPGAYQKAEVEQAAALIIHTLADLKSDWAPVRREDVVAFIDAHAETTLRHVARSPFFRPDVNELVRRGYATRVNGVIVLTPDAIDRACSAVGLKEKEVPRG